MSDINPLSAQQVFDLVAKHLLTQRRPAVTEKGDACVYRAKDGSKCAIGCLIPDEKYNPDLEHFSLQSDPLQAVLPPMSDEAFELLDRLKEVHDLWYWNQQLLSYPHRDFTSYVKDCLETLANCHKLDNSVLKEV